MYKRRWNLFSQPLQPPDVAFLVPFLPVVDSNPQQHHSV